MKQEHFKIEFVSLRDPRLLDRDNRLKRKPKFLSVFPDKTTNQPHHSKGVQLEKMESKKPEGDQLPYCFITVGNR